MLVLNIKYSHVNHLCLTELSTAPELADLMEWIPDIAGVWDKVLIQLMSKHSGLKSTIEKDYKKSEDCCQEMFSKWCDLYHNRTWNDLIKALKSRSVGKPVLANKIIQHLSKHTIVCHIH